MTSEEEKLEAKIKITKEKIKKWKTESLEQHMVEADEIAKIKAKGGDYKALIQKAKDRVKADMKKVNQK